MKDAMNEAKGLARGLTHYGDPDFARYLRRSFAKPMGYSDEMLSRPIVGIANSASGFNNCHRHFPELIEAEDFLVLQNAGPRSAPGMPEAGYLPIPAKLARQDVAGMIRLSDARMSGTAFGTVILHLSPEAAVGGPLAQVRSGDLIRLSVSERRLDLLVDAAELARRRAATGAATITTPLRGYAKPYAEHLLQADQDCDFDFLRAGGV